MATSEQVKEAIAAVKEAAAPEQPRSLAVAAKGIKTAGDFSRLMSTLMSDLIEGRITPSIGNATCNAGGKLLKVVEMQYKYGTKGDGQGRRTLTLTFDTDDEPPK